jgi:hypothetical protein
MSEFLREIMSCSDEQLAERLSGPMPGSTNHEIIKFEMQRRAMNAQRRAADAAERYTRATYVFIVVTALAGLLSAFTNILG